jgi:hypothetical protein
MTKKVTRFVHAGRFAAAVPIDLIPDDDAWGPYLSMDDALKLERVTEALERGDIAAAAREAKVFELLPVSA